jgi:hypothetical protein
MSFDNRIIKAWKFQWCTIKGAVPYARDAKKKQIDIPPFIAVATTKLLSGH